MQLPARLFSLITILTSLALFASCGKTVVVSDVEIQANVDHDDEVYKVFSAIIVDEWPSPGNPDLVLQISDKTLIDGRRPMTLKSRFLIDKKYELVDGQMLLADLESLDPKSFRSKYPHYAGLLSFNSVTFNEKFDKATVGVDYYCPLCGFGATFDLEKDTGEWRVVTRVTGWES